MILAALIFDLELAAQQTARIVRHPLDPLLHGLIVLVLLLAALVRAQAHRLRLLVSFLGVFLHGLAHLLAELLLRLLLGFVAWLLGVRRLLLVAVFAFAGLLLLLLTVLCLRVLRLLTLLLLVEPKLL